MTNNWNYNRFVCSIYKIEVGVLLDKDDEEYDKYLYYDKEHSYYEENTVIELDYLSALNYAKNYVKNGVKNTYAIISKFPYDTEKIYGNGKEGIDCAMNDINYILGGGYMEDYIGCFLEYGVYETDNVIYSLYKDYNNDYIKNFVKTKEELIVEFMFDNSYIIVSEYDHWFEDDIISIDQKIACLYLTLEEMKKLHLAVEKEKELERDITEILVKYEKENI